MYITDVIFKEHGRVTSGTNWNGSPGNDGRNIRRMCICREPIDWHDRSREKPGRAYPLSGEAFDPPHLSHIREVLEELGYE